MKKALVRLFWELSTSEDVVEQCLKVDSALMGEDHVDLDNFVTEYQTTVAEDDDVFVTMVVKDEAGNESAPATLTFNVGDLTAPLAPTGLGFEVLEVIEEEDTETEE